MTCALVLKKIVDLFTTVSDLNFFLNLKTTYLFLSTQEFERISRIDDKMGGCRSFEKSSFEFESKTG